MAGLAVLFAVAFHLYSRDMVRIDQRLLAGSEVAETRHGQIEFSGPGTGPAVLVVLGAGGGHLLFVHLPDVRERVISFLGAHMPAGR